ncbi:MAG: hypothetical protein RJA44_1615 [Pseudomonadota bacterium]
MATKNIRATVKTVPVKHQPSGLPAAELGLAKVFIKPASEYVPARLPAGKVLHITGNAIVRTNDGLLHELHVGDVLTRGDMVLTSQNGYVQIEAPGSAAARQPFESGILALPEIDRALLELSQLSISPDAGMDGEGNLSPGFQVDRIAEVVSASAFAFDPANAAGGFGTPFINQAAVAPFIIGIDPVHVTVDPVTGAIRINPGDTYQEQNQEHVVFQINLSTPPAADTNIKLSTAGTTAANDFQGGNATVPLEVSSDGGQTWQVVSGGTALIPAGHTSLLVRTPQIQDDPVYEGPETLQLVAALVNQNNTPVTATAIIVDEEDRPKVNPVDPADGKPDGIEIVTPTDPNNPDPNHPSDSGAWSVQTGNLLESDVDQTAYFRINLSGTAAIPIALHVDVQNGTALIGSDYSNLQYWNGSSWADFTGTANGASADITVPANTSALILRLAVKGDNVTEVVENLTVSAYTQAQPITPIQRVISIDDDDANPVSPALLLRVNEDAGDVSVTSNPQGVSSYTVNNPNAPTSITGKLVLLDADNPATVTVTQFTVGNSAVVHVTTDPTQPVSQIQLTDASGNPIAGAFFYLKSDGSYGYTLPADYNSTQSPALPSITYTVSDGTSANNILSTLNLDVTPVNDAPVPKADQSQLLTEAATGGSAGTSTVSGNVITGANDLRGAAAGLDTDIDSTTLTITSISTPASGQNVTAGTPVTINGTYGSLTINSDGSYTYNLDNNNAATDALKATDQAQDVFTYTVSDGNGGSSTATLAVNIQGTNDAPTINPTNDPTARNPLVLDESGLASGSNPSPAVITSTKTITITDSDTLAANLSFSLAISGDANTAFTLTHINDATVLQGSAAPATADEAKLFHFDVASRKYYEVVLDNASSTNLQKTWYADINGNNQMDSGEAVLRVTLAQQAATGNTLTLNYKAELLGSLYHNSDYNFSYDTVNNWSIDATLAANQITTNNIHLVVSDGVNTTTDTTEKLMTVSMTDDQPRIARGGFTTGADGGYIYQWSVIQWVDLPGDGVSTKVATHMTYWVDYDSTTRQYNWGGMRYQDNPYANPTATDQIIQGAVEATDRASLSIDHPFFLDRANDHLFIYNSLGITYDINLKANTFTTDSPSTGYLRDAFEYSMFDYDGRLVTLKQSGSTNIDNSAITGSNASEPLYGVSTDELLTGKAGNDTIYGDGLDAVSYQDRGADTIVGGTGNDVLYGGSYGTPVLATFTGYAANGAAVVDTLYTNTANQYSTVNGQASMHTTDVFQWQLNDGGTAGAPAIDTVMDFDIAKDIGFLAGGTIDPVGHGDVLDLKDLLVGEHDGTTGLAANLNQFLEVTTTGGSTTLHVSTTGQFNGSNTGTVEDQAIVLQNVDLHALPGLSGASTSADIIQALINQNRLVVDH